jgi:hypothetical protein
MNSRNIFLSVLGVLFIFFIGWFSWLYFEDTTSATANFYSNTYGIIPLLGGVYGLVTASRWSGFRSTVGKAVIFLSLGLVTWGCGMVIWLYFNIVLGVAVPYPSLADVAFIISWPLWAVGAAYLSIATGARFGLEELKGKIGLIIVPCVIVAFSYYFLVVLARQGVLSIYDGSVKTFFDLAYPIGDIVILTISLLIFGLSYKYLGGILKWAIYLILAAFIVNYFADFTFSYTTTLGTYYNGSLADVLFVTAMTLLSSGIALLDPTRDAKEASTA